MKKAFKKKDKVRLKNLPKFIAAYELDVKKAYLVTGVAGRKDGTVGQYILLDGQGEKRFYAPYFELA